MIEGGEENKKNENFWKEKEINEEEIKKEEEGRKIEREEEIKKIWGREAGRNKIEEEKRKWNNKN